MQFLIGFLFGGAFGVIGTCIVVGFNSKDDYMEGYADCYDEHVLKRKKK